MSKTTVVYGCGGAGINVAARYLIQENDSNFTSFHPVALDTSLSNVSKHDYPEDSIYVIPDMDGAGGLRSLGVPMIRPHIEPMLAKNPPGDLNIVIASAGGGSGSVIGPLLAGRLLQEGKDVVFVMLECGHNRVHMVNTKRTLETLYGVASRANSNMAVVLIPLDNQAVQNKKVHNIVGSLSMLWSGNNEALDSQDLNHFLHHQVHSQITGSINLLTVYSNPADVMATKQPIAIASIYRDRDMDQIHPPCIYHTHGFNKLSEHAADQFHFVLSEAELVPFIDRINDGVKAIEEQLKAEAKPNLGLNSKDADDDGIVC